MYDQYSLKKTCAKESVLLVLLETNQEYSFSAAHDSEYPQLRIFEAVVSMFLKDMQREAE